jgi:hypothetical protein
MVTADEALFQDGEFAVTLSGGDTVPAQLVGRDPTADVAHAGSRDGMAAPRKRAYRRRQYDQGELAQWGGGAHLR